MKMKVAVVVEVQESQIAVVALSVGGIMLVLCDDAKE